MSASHHPFDQEELMAFLDGELPAERAVGAAEHLKQCAACQQLARDFSQVSQALTGWQVEEAESTVPPALSRVLDQQKTPATPGKLGGLSALRRFVGLRQLAWSGGLVAATLLVVAIFAPRLLTRNRVAVERSAPSPVVAQRQDANGATGSAGKSSNGDALSDFGNAKQIAPEFGRNKGATTNAIRDGRLAAKESRARSKAGAADQFDRLEASKGFVPAPPPPPAATPAPGNAFASVTNGAVAQDGIAGNDTATPGAVANYKNSWQQPPRGPAMKQNQADVQLQAKAAPAPAVITGAAPAAKDESKAKPETAEVAAAAAQTTPPLVIRTAELALTSKDKDFDQAQARVEEILRRHHGYVGEMNLNTPSGSARSLTATLRVPANQLEATVADLKQMGRVERESQNGEDVTLQYVDLESRLRNSRNTEQRLTELQRERTGKLSDVLSVEMQISRVRGEIEQMEGQRKAMRNQVDYATLTLTITEDYKAELNVVPPSTGTLIRNAAVDGYRSLMDGLLGLLLWLLSWLPSLLLWFAVLFYPARYTWRRVKQHLGQRELVA